MKKLIAKLVGAALVACAPLAFTAAVRAAADTCTWTGGGSDNNFSTAGNWSDGAGLVVECDNSNVPESGDILVFPETALGDSRAMTNDMTAMSFAGLQFMGVVTLDPSNLYSIVGNGITLTGNISNTSDKAVSLNNNYILGSNIAITSSTGGHIYIGNSIDPAETLTLSTYNLSVTTTGFVRIISSISGSGSITKTGTGVVSLLGNSSSYTGAISITGSTANISPSAFGTTAGSTTIGAATTLSICDNSLSDTTIAENFVFIGEGFATDEPKLAFLRSTCIGGGGGAGDNSDGPYTILSGSLSLDTNMILTGYNRDAKLTGALNGAGLTLSLINGTGFQLLINGASNNMATVNGTYNSQLKTVTYTGDQSSTQANVEYNNLAIVSAGAVLGDVYLSGGTLKGVGTVGDIYLTGGIVAPGMSPGCLSSGDINYSGGTLQIEINGATVCTEYDQQTVTGTVVLGTTTTLSISRLSTYVPALNSSYTIISNDAADAVTGTFAGLAQGASVTVDGVTYSISYTGGDGNDVVLLVTAVAASVGAPNTGFEMIRSSMIMPLLAIVSGLGIMGIRKFASKKF